MMKLACMTLPYSNVPFERALEGISRAGFRYVAFGLPHAGVDVPDESDSDAAAKLQLLFERYQLEPIMLISTNQLAPGQTIERARFRIELAKALRIPEMLSLGTWGYRDFPDDPLPEKEMLELNRLFVDKFRELASIAESNGVTITLKPHTGNTATAQHLLQTLREIGSDFVKASYDPGNVHYYEGIDAVADFTMIAADTVSLVAKDHRGAKGNPDFPIPGEGDIDFSSLFRIWQDKGLGKTNSSGTVVVERVDGKGEEMNPEQIDELMAKTRSKLATILKTVGLG